jgi:anti-sigma B factor antagonist
MGIAESRHGRPFGLWIRPHGDTVVVEASGELDLSAAGGFETELRQVLARNGATVVLDLSGLEFIDSSGLRALLVLAFESSVNGSRLGVRRELSPAVQRTFDLTGIGDRLPFVD